MITAMDAGSVTFTDLRQDVEQIVRAFCYRYNVKDREEAMSAALVYYMEALEIAEATGADVTETVRLIIWRRLYTQWRTEAGIRRAAGRRKDLDIDYQIVAPEYRRAGARHGGAELLVADGNATKFNLLDFVYFLSKDAGAVIDLAINTPDDLTAVAKSRGGCPNNLRAVIRAHLRAKGWTIGRINEAFAEIKEALA